MNDGRSFPARCCQVLWRDRDPARHRLGGEGWRVRRLRRPVGLRQVDVASHHRRSRDGQRRRDQDRRPARERAAAGGSQDRDGVPVLCALPAYERLQEHGLRPEIRQDRQGGGGSPRAPGGGNPEADAASPPKAAGIVRRPAPACGHRPCHRAQPERLPVRRAALESRRGLARQHAPRNRQAPPGSRRDDDLRHARSGRGDDPRLQDRGA